MVDLESTLATVSYYARERHYRHIQSAISEQMRRFGSDPLLIYWVGYGMVMEDRITDGMKELSKVEDHPDLVISASLMLIHAHKKCQTVDKEAVQALENTVRAHRSTAGEKALYNGATTLWLLGKHDKAREYTEKLLQRVAPKSRECRSLRGWIDLTSDRELLSKKSIKYFEEALHSSESVLLDAALGKVEYYATRYNFVAALDMLNKIIASHDSFLPALLKKVQVELALHDWDGVVDTAQRCLKCDEECVMATRMLCLEAAVRRGDMTESAELLAKLIEQLDSSEPRSHMLYYETALVFSRLAGGCEPVLTQTRIMLERAMSLQPTSDDYTVELAHQALMEGKLQEALQMYRRAFSFNEMSIPAMIGVLQCQLLMGNCSDAKQQLDFLRELEISAIDKAYLAYLNGLLTSLKGEAPQRVIECLNEAAEIHLTTLKGYHLSYDYFKLVDADFLARLAQLMMSYGPSEPNPSYSSMLDKVVLVLDPLTSTAPGLHSILLLLAKVKFLSGDSEGAMALAHSCLEDKHLSIPALILQATVHLHTSNLAGCRQVLETALSSNFEVQQYSLYNLLKGRLHRSSNQLQEAAKSFQVTVQLIRTANKKNKMTLAPLLPPLTKGEQVTAYTELVQTLSALNQQDEARKVMQEAIELFSGTSEEARITIAQASLLLSLNDTTQALNLLKQISNDKSYYIEAQEMVAMIYLKHYQDKKRYIYCYEQLCREVPGPETSLLLGNAHLHVQQPHLALTVFEKALKRAPHHAVLASRVGHVLVSTHQYNKAINYYETSLKSGGASSLTCDLAKLYMKLQQYDKACKTLQAAMERPAGGEDELAAGRHQVQCTLLLAEALQLQGNSSKSAEVLFSAKQLQEKVLHKAAAEQSEVLLTEKKRAASIALQMAERSHSLGHDPAVTTQHCQYSLQHQPNSSRAQLLLAKISLQQGQLDECEQHCQLVLQHDPINEEAVIMIADILFQRGEVSTAKKKLEDILDTKPENFEALLRLIELMRRSGKLKEMNKFLTMIESRCTQVIHQPGLTYCKGMYYRYMGETELAMKSFNQARKDSDWEDKALFNMVEICINPDHDTLGGDTLKAIDGGDVDTHDTEVMAAHTAEKLLKEVRPHSPESKLKLKVLEYSILLASKSKQNAEKALTGFTELISQERESVTLLLGVATAHMIMKQVPRARNHLKRIVKMNWTMETAEDYEKAWLLLADLYVQSGKHDVATELLKRCIHYNKSCSKGWEYLGFISEKEQAYKDAADYYCKAWTFSHHTNPAVGYRLAFNHLKAHQYIEAVDVCHKVLESHPTYPRIRKEVMEKARQNIRL